MNKLIVIGRLTKDCSIYKTKNDMEYIRYSVAVSEYSKEEKSPIFIDCVDFTTKANFAINYLKKGVKVALVGKLQSVNNNNINVQVTEIELLESKKATENKENSDSKETTTSTVEKTELQPISDEDCPF